MSQKKQELCDGFLKKKKKKLKKKKKIANLQDFDTIYEDIMKEDPEFPKLKCLACLGETIEE